MRVRPPPRPPALAAGLLLLAAATAFSPIPIPNRIPRSLPRGRRPAAMPAAPRRMYIGDGGEDGEGGGGHRLAEARLARIALRVPDVAVPRGAGLRERGQRGAENAEAPGLHLPGLGVLSRQLPGSRAAGGHGGEG